MPEELVTITKSEYDRLLEADRFLDALSSAGVDSWEGYNYALEIYYGII